MMVMWKLRSCPRCDGAVFLDRDLYSWYEQCVHCGYMRDLKSIDEFNELSAKNEKERTVAGTGQETLTSEKSGNDRN